MIIWCVDIIEYITVSTNVVMAIAATVAAWVAYGARNWRRELRDKADLDTARSFRRATYKLRDAISKARTAFVSAGEFPKDYSPVSEFPSQRKDAKKEADAYRYIFANRLEAVRDALSEFEVNVVEAEALWGPEIKPKTKKLVECVKQLKTSMWLIIEDKAERGKVFEKEPGAAKYHDNIVFEYTEESEFSIKIADAVSTIDEITRPYLNRK